MCIFKISGDREPIRFGGHLFGKPGGRTARNHFDHRDAAIIEPK